MQFVQNYRYNSLYRLTSASEMAGETETWSRNFQYDRYGNRTEFHQRIGDSQRTDSSSLFKILLISLLVFMTVTLGACNPRNLPIIKNLVKASEKERTKHTAELIEASAQMKQLDSICAQIPVPDGFEFVWKDGYNDEHKLISSYYFSEMYFDESQRVWFSYFKDDGWEVYVDSLSYPKFVSAKKGTYTAKIQYGGMGDRTNYSIGCEVVKID